MVTARKQVGASSTYGTLRSWQPPRSSYDQLRQAGQQTSSGDLEVLLEGAGFDDVRVERVHHEVRLSGADEWWAWKWSYSLRGVLEQLPPERVERFRVEAAERLATMPASADGLPLRLEALVGVGRR